MPIPDGAIRAAGNAIRQPGQTAEDADVQAERALVALLAWLRSPEAVKVWTREQLAHDRHWGIGQADDALLANLAELAGDA